MIAPWHYTTPLDLVDHWQTLFAGLLAIVAAILTVIGMIKTAKMQMSATRETTSRQIEATIAAARLQVEAAQAQTREARERLAQKKKEAAQIISGAMTDLLTAARTTLADFRGHPSTTRYGSTIFGTDLHMFEHLRPYLLLFSAEASLQLVRIEDDAARMREPRSEYNTMGAAGDAIEAFGKKLSAFIDEVESEAVDVTNHANTSSSIPQNSTS